MDLSTKYLGFDLPNPLMPGASPLADNLDTVKRVEDAGASAIIMRSLFEEQIVREEVSLLGELEENAEIFAEAMSFFPRPREFALGPYEYLEHVRKVKDAVSVPVIASLNGTTASGWLEYAELIAEAGADALELNVYLLSVDPRESGAEVEQRVVDIVRSIRARVDLPLAVKLSPFFSSIPNLASRLEQAGAGALVIFNRFYQPDIDVDELEVVPTVHLSDSSELLLRLRWLAILAGRVKTSLAVTGGVHTAVDAVKAIMAGADAVQVVSALLIHGPQRLTQIGKEMAQWLEEREYESLTQARGSMSLLRSPDPGAFERANYMRVLQSWRV